MREGSETEADKDYWIWVPLLLKGTVPHLIHNPQESKRTNSSSVSLFVKGRFNLTKLLYCFEWILNYVQNPEN